jgi:hypothetical protein
MVAESPSRVVGRSDRWRHAMDAVVPVGVMTGFKTLRDMHVNSTIDFTALEIVKHLGGNDFAMTQMHGIVKYCLIMNFELSLCFSQMLDEVSCHLTS